MGGAFLVGRHPPGAPAWAAAWCRGLWPPGAQFAGNSAACLGAVASATGVLFILDAVGLRLLEWFGTGKPRVALRCASPFLGYAVASLGLLGLATAGIWFVPTVWGWLGGLAVWGWDRGRVTASSWAAGVRGLRWSRDPGMGWMLVPPATVGAILLLTPELQIDCLEYHLAYPRHLFAAHRVPSGDQYMNWLNALAADLPNGFFLIAGGDAAARLLRPVLMLVGALACSMELTRCLHPRGREIPVVLLIASILVPAGSGVLLTAKSDGVVGGALLTLCALALGASGGRPPVRRALTAGVVTGFVLSAKVVLAPLVLCLLVAIGSTDPGGLRRRWWLPGGAGAALLVLPWCAKAWAITGDPVFPVLAAAGWLHSLGAAGELRAALDHFMDPARVWAGAPGEWLSMVGANAFPCLALLPLCSASGFAAARRLAGAALLGVFAMVVGLRFGYELVERFCGPAFVFLNLCAAVLVSRRQGRPWVFARWTWACATLVMTGRIALVTWTPRLAEQAGAAFAGRTGWSAFRLDALGSYGRILEAVEARTSGGAEGVLMTGDTVQWGMPAGVLGEGLLPRLPWRSARAAVTEERIAVQFRQAGVRWVVYNSWRADWERRHDRPYPWDRRMLSVYRAFVARHLVLRASSGVVDPVWGSHWLFEVTPAARLRPGPVLFLPGAERAFAAPGPSATHPGIRATVASLRELKAILPDVAVVDAMLGHALVRAGRFHEAAPRVSASVRAGVIHDLNLLDLAIVEGKAGRRGAAADALRRARDVYRDPAWDPLLTHARREAGLD